MVLSLVFVVHLIFLDHIFLKQFSYESFLRDLLKLIFKDTDCVTNTVILLRRLGHFLAKCQSLSLCPCLHSFTVLVAIQGIKFELGTVQVVDFKLCTYPDLVVGSFI